MSVSVSWPGVQCFFSLSVASSLAATARVSVADASLGLTDVAQCCCCCRPDDEVGGSSPCRGDSGGTLMLVAELALAYIWFSVRPLLLAELRM